jgi:hypothetical protein
MQKTRISPALAARLLAERAQPELLLRLELPAFDHRYCEPPQDDAEGGEPRALVLEADGSFTEIRD